MNKLIEKFAKLGEEAELHNKTLKSLETYRKLVSRENDITNIGTVIEGLPPISRLRAGDMIIFEYSAKTQDILPYWDRYPLVLVNKVTTHGWEGYNLHYLHPNIRARLIFQSNKGYDIIDNDLVKPAIKKYLAKHVLVRAREVKPSLWPVVAFMPFENFAKENKYTVWRKTSRKKK